MATPSSPANAMPPAATSPLQPTFRGFVGDTKDALQLFEATLQGQLQRVTRRPHDRERPTLIQSGSIFIYEEGASGIKRWTDGVPWSPSRILNNFLIYRELERPFPPGEKKRAKPKSRSEGPETPVKQEQGDAMLGSPATPHTSNSPAVRNDSSSERDAQRSLVGSLTDSYQFKDRGLIKKTMSVNVDGTTFHLVSYYNPDDVTSGQLDRPSTHVELKFIIPRTDLVHRQNFRAPLEGTEEGLSPGGYPPPQARPPYTTAHPSYVPQPAYVGHPHPQQHPFQSAPQYVQYQQSQEAYPAQRQPFPMSQPPPQHTAQYGEMPPVSQMQMRHPQTQTQYAQYGYPQDPRAYHQGQQHFAQQPPMGGGNSWQGQPHQR
ncbi:MAG: hypothetical protein M1831_001875 [Alyxoria varia]|nr:MAG: hypothetical protein M1831_001875 [Alyxoria varia]